MFGANVTSRGVLFVQPGELGSNVCIAGDFNRWRPEATKLAHNPALDLHEGLVQISPGRHQYRIVVAGRWMIDPYNAAKELSRHGELNSVLVVPDRGAVQ